MKIKQSLSLLLSAAIAIACTSVTAFASETAATIGDAGYSTLTEAINAAKDMTGDVTINLTADVNFEGGSFDLTKSSVTGLTLAGNNTAKIITGQDGNGIDGPVYCKKLLIKLPDGAPLNIQNIVFPNDIMLDANTNNPVVVEGCTFNGSQSGYPASTSITYTRNTFDFKGSAANFYSNNAYPIWWKLDHAEDFTFTNNTVKGYRGVHIETRNGNEKVNITATGNTFDLSDAGNPRKAVALQLVNKLTGNVSFENNTITNAYGAVCLYENLTAYEGGKLTIKNNTIPSETKLTCSSDWHANAVGFDQTFISENNDIVDIDSAAKSEPTVSTSDAAIANGSDGSVAAGFVTTITAANGEETEISSIEWNISSNGTVKNTGAHTINKITTRGTLTIGLIVNNLDDAAAKAEATVK